METYQYKPGDYVVRKSYNKDILFRIVTINSQNIAKLKGVSYRILADSHVADLEIAGGMRFTSNESSTMKIISSNVEKILIEHKKINATKLHKTGKVLHIDGDTFYLNLCLKYYDVLGIQAVGENISESKQSTKVIELIEKYNPDILVLTGHDSLSKNSTSEDVLDNYTNSKHFINAVKQARTIRPTSDSLIIYAGACQSYFEEILSAGADFASSPNRILIHALDPAFVVEKIAYCPFYKVLPVEEAIKYTITKDKGIGGYEILGKARVGGSIIMQESLDNKSVSVDSNQDEADITENRRNILGNSMPNNI
ncbi:MAG: sporulation peptidase YabG [Epulopiscium sp. Nuni2H_MBin003]|nr:MAG: sporulation peptidase YabG [Epulopiscium sp. Nuni2H_MBin003]